MKPEELDRVLSEEADLVPSSGFVARVMDAVTTEATSPPLAFPWTRAWPLAAGFAALLLWLARLLFQPASNAPGFDVYAWLEMIAPMAGGWVIGAVVMTVAITAWSLRLVRLR